jgi:C-terminal processing protease CtpA/Prc
MLYFLRKMKKHKKKIIIISILLLITLFVCKILFYPGKTDYKGIGQIKYLSKIENFNDTSRLYYLCKVWGFLKYFHPEVSEGKYNWDSLLISSIEPVKNAKTKEEFIEEIQKILQFAGFVETEDTENVNLNPEFSNANFEWLNDTLFFDKGTQKELEKILKLNKHDDYYLWSFEGFLIFENETNYKIDTFPSDYTLLALFRAWNVLNYFNPNKYLLTNNWDSVLIDFIPKFQQLEAKQNYINAVRAFSTNIQDGHSQIPVFNGSSIPFKTSILNNKLYITKILIDSLEQFELGDEIIEKGEIPISYTIDSMKKYLSTSNELSLINYVNNQIVYTKKSKIKIKYVNSLNDTIEIDIPTCLNGDLEKDTTVFKLYKNNIGYIDIGLLLLKNFDSVLNEVLNTKNLIVDLREYPGNTTIHKLLSYFEREQFDFVKFYKPSKENIGNFYTVTNNVSFKLLLKYYRTVQRKRFEGKIVVLIDEKTQSHGEYCAMAWKTVKNCTLIGRNTAGADGNVAEIPLPDKFKILYSGLGVIYPDGSQTQRIGIVPDIYVEQTLEGIKSGKDEILERAIEFIETGK